MAAAAGAGASSAASGVFQIGSGIVEATITVAKGTGHAGHTLVRGVFVAGYEVLSLGGFLLYIIGFIVFMVVFYYFGFAARILDRLVVPFTSLRRTRDLGESIASVFPPGPLRFVARICIVLPLCFFYAICCALHVFLHNFGIIFLAVVLLLVISVVEGAAAAALELAHTHADAASAAYNLAATTGNIGLKIGSILQPAMTATTVVNSESLIFVIDSVVPAATGSAAGRRLDGLNFDEIAAVVAAPIAAAAFLYIVVNRAKLSVARILLAIFGAFIVYIVTLLGFAVAKFGCCAAAPQCCFYEAIGQVVDVLSFGLGGGASIYCSQATLNGGAGIECGAPNAFPASCTGELFDSVYYGVFRNGW